MTSTTTELTATISGTYSWNPGHGVLASLHAVPSEGYSRQGVGGSVADFHAALSAAKAARASAKGGDKVAHTALVKSLAGAIIATECHASYAAHAARFAELTR